MATVNTTTKVLTLTVTASVDVWPGTISQTLPAVTQAATAWHMDQFIGVVQASGEPVQQIIETLTSTVLPGEALSAILTNDYADTVQISDTFTYDRLNRLTGGVNVSEQLNVNWTTTFTPEGIAAYGYLTSSVTQELVSTVNASETITTIRSGSLQGSAYASEVITTQQVVTGQTLTSTVQVRGEIHNIHTSDTLVSVAQVTDTLTDTRSVTESLSSATNASSVVTGSASSFEELLSTVTADNGIFFNGSVYNVALHDTVDILGIPWAADPNAIAWVVNTETGGLSNYDNFDFTSVTAHNGVLYATSNNGVYSMVGDLDSSRSITATCKTGFLDFGVPQTKRISDVYVGYTGGALSLDVETYDGPQEVYTYDMEERSADAPRNNRIKVGKGLSSRYWRFSFKNVDGADFQVYDTAVNAGVSKRRL